MKATTELRRKMEITEISQGNDVGFGYRHGFQAFFPLRDLLFSLRVPVVSLPIRIAGKERKP